MARATSATASSRVMSSLKPASNTAMAARLPEPMVQKGRLSVEPCGCTCRPKKLCQLPQKRYTLSKH